MSPPPPPPSFVDDPPPVYWLAIDPDYQDKENELDPSDMHQYITANFADSSDDDESDQALINNALYPVFTRPCPSKPRLGKRRDQSGAVLKGYKKPRVQARSKKLKPAIIPKQTNFSRNQKEINAVGKNTLFMSNWLGLSQSTSTSMTSTSVNLQENDQHNSNTSSDSFDESDSNSSSESEQSNYNHSTNTFSPNLAAAHNKWIDECVTCYCNTTKPPSGPERAKKAAQDCFDKLQASILVVSNKYKEEARKNPSFEYPSRIFDDLQEYNTRRLELTLSNAKSPAVTASWLTAASSVRREISVKKVNAPTSGVSRAKTIRKQAVNVSKFQELILSSRGFGSSHPSMLDYKQVFDLLYSWAVAKKPGELSFPS